MTISSLLIKVFPLFRALPVFRAPKAVDGPSALNPGTTVIVLFSVLASRSSSLEPAWIEMLLRCTRGSRPHVPHLMAKRWS